MYFTQEGAIIKPTHSIGDSGSFVAASFHLFDSPVMLMRVYLSGMTINLLFTYPTLDFFLGGNLFSDK